MPPLTPALKNEYEQLFKTCRTRPKRAATVDALIDRIAAGKPKYLPVAQRAGVPWHVIAVIHLLEAGLRFDAHLHNGDPLTKRTVRWPPGRPKTGKPPFTWRQSALDALQGNGLAAWNDWSVGGTLYVLERYNGSGYRDRNVANPYLWSFSQHYTKGKYTRDHHYDPNAVSEQCGTGTILRRMADRRLINLGPKRPADPQVLTVTNPPIVGPDVKVAQRLLKRNKYRDFDPGRVDGEYGELTAGAVVDAKWELGYPDRQVNGNFGPKLRAYLEGKPLPPDYRKRRIRRLKGGKGEDAIRKRIVAWALWGAKSTGRISYSQGPSRLAALETPGKLPLASDCSAFATLCYKWAKAPNPNASGDYNPAGLNYTGSMLDHCRRIPPGAVKPGDLVVFSGPTKTDGSHVCVVIMPGRDPWVVSHGSNEGPIRDRFSNQLGNQRANGYGTVTWLSAFIQGTGRGR